MSEKIQEECGALLRHIFHAVFCVQEDVAEDRKYEVNAYFFFGWLQERARLGLLSDVHEEAHVSCEAWEHLKELIESGQVVERYLPSWWQIVLSSRGPAKHKLTSLTLSLLLRWEDGVVIPIQVNLDHVMMETGQWFDDAVVATILAAQASYFHRNVAMVGLDALHDSGKDYRGKTPEDPFEVLMGALVHKVVPQLREDIREKALDYARLAQGIIRPVIPPDALAEMEKRRQAWLAANTKVTGGWDA